ncbi:gliding motility-associated C-terminal domain-containing protein, partial [Longitalea luteola]|uniref:T9SS type B sorting domain-containing protein n=1 Tax=Longitalea luteola TaxID=2812563 RepID=UPI001A96A60F
LPYRWNGINITAAGTYSDTLTSKAGCDSIINLILTVNTVLRDTTRATICTNQLPYRWNGININAAGTYRDTLISRSGCDSITNLILTVNSILRDTTIATICTNQLPYRWNGININAAGTYKDTLISRSGCDSITNLILTVNSILRDTTRATICTNQLPYNWNGININAAGTYSDTLISSAGCDSITNLILTVNSILTDTTTATICTNQLPYNWIGNAYNTAGTYNVTLTSTAGCDSIATLILNINPTLSSTQTVTICPVQLPYSWNGNTYNAAGTYTATRTSVAGCDSVITLILNVSSSFSRTENIATCEPSYRLPNGTVATASGVYTSTFTNQAGCDSTIITNLTLQPSPNLKVNNPAAECKPTIDITAAAITAGSDPDLILSYWTNPTATSPLTTPNAVSNNGIYYIKATNAAGCQSIKSVSVQINRAPTANITAGNICPGVKTKLTITFSGQAPFGVTYTDGTANYTFNNISTSVYETEIAPITNTTYTITSVSDALCTNTAVNASATANLIIPPAGLRYNEVLTGINQSTQLRARDLGSNYAYKWTPSIGLSKSDIRTPVFNYSQRMDYLIYITSDGGCIVVDTQTVKVIARTQVNEPPNLWVPTAWSPHNKDGHNDLLFPFTVNIVELRYFRVFNRWGELVFETRELGKGWDGIYKGVPQVMDTYTWTVEAVGNDGTVFKKAGNAMLLR